MSYIDQTGTLFFKDVCTEPVLKCFVCDAEVPFSFIREHTETHNTGETSKVQYFITACSLERGWGNILDLSL